MSTAFQPNAFQGTGFQIAGGLTTTDVELTVNGTQEGDSGSFSLDIAADATGGWPIYYPRRKKRPVVEIQPEIAAVQLKEAEDRLKLRREIRRQERHSREITEQIREILDQQDNLKLKIQLTNEIQANIDDEEAIIAILALAG